MEDTFDVWWWLDKFGLTPDQVHALPIKYRHRLPWVVDVVERIRREEEKR